MNALKDKISELPSLPGVYVMHDASGQIIYVGKAKNLKHRVSSYFQKNHKTEKVSQMVKNIADFEYYIVPSELDAFVLERNLIRKHQPYFNILLKDGKSYPYIKVDTTEKYPRFEITRKVKKDRAKYFGPWLGGIDVKDILETINYAYPIRTCKLKVDGIKFQKRACLNYSMGLCSAPCTNAISCEKYGEYVKKVIAFLQGDEKAVETILKEKMETASSGENYETAIKLREKLKMLEKMKQKITVELPKNKSFDVFAYATNEVFGVVCMLCVRMGKILSVQNFNAIDASMNEGDMLASFVSQYYLQNVDSPNEVVVGEVLEDKALIESFLTEKCGKKLVLTTAKSGEKHRLVMIAKKNAEDYLQKSIDKQKKQSIEASKSLLNLKSALDIPVMPRRIECYDISHISGTLKVGSMVVFENAEPKRQMYRKFKIKTIEGNDDFHCLQEVLSRRLDELEKQEDVSFSKQPDLIVIDGGKGQLSSVEQKFKERNIDIFIISLAKQFEEVFIKGSNQPVMLRRASPELRLLQNIRDEAHRFAITFHRSLRSKKMLESEFDVLKGVGKKRKEILQQEFGSIENMKRAGVENLSKLESLGKQLAKDIFEQLSKDK